MGSRIAVLDAGELQQVGAPLELYDRPTNLFVARFIGTPPMNILKARVGEDAASLQVAGASLPLVAALRPLVQGAGGREIFVGLRPEHLRGKSVSDRGETAAIRVKVEMIETLGYEMLVHGRCGEDRLVAKVDPHDKPELDTEIDLFAELSALQLFDAATQRRLTPGA